MSDESGPAWLSWHPIYWIIVILVIGAGAYYTQFMGKMGEKAAEEVAPPKSKPSEEDAHAKKIRTDSQKDQSKIQTGLVVTRVEKTTGRFEGSLFTVHLTNHSDSRATISGVAWEWIPGIEYATYMASSGPEYPNAKYTISTDAKQPGTQNLEPQYGIPAKDGGAFTLLFRPKAHSNKRGTTTLERLPIMEPSQPEQGDLQFQNSEILKVFLFDSSGNQYQIAPFSNAGPGIPAGPTEPNIKQDMSNSPGAQQFAAGRDLTIINSQAQPNLLTLRMPLAEPTYNKESKQWTQILELHPKSRAPVPPITVTIDFGTPILTGTVEHIRYIEQKPTIHPGAQKWTFKSTDKVYSFDYFSQLGNSWVRITVQSTEKVTPKVQSQLQE